MRQFFLSVVFVFFIFCGEIYAVNPYKLMDRTFPDSDCTDCIRCPSEISIYNPSFSPDGRFIVFEGDCRNSKAIYRIRADGSGLCKLTQPFGAIDATPIYSSDGQKILFSCFFTKTSCIDLCMMNADGSDPIWLTKDGKGGFEPVFSRDGKIIYSISSCPKGESLSFDIYAVNTDGTVRKKLIDMRSFMIHSLSLSPDGNNLLFERTTYNTTPKDESLWIYSFARGKAEPLRPDVTEYVSGKKPFTDYSGFAYPRYSPDGRFILFVWPGYYQGYYGHEIYIMDTVSLKAKKVTDLRGSIRAPSFSPDGRKIVFAFEKNFRNDRPSEFELWTVGSDGSDPKKIDLRQ